MYGNKFYDVGVYGAQVELNFTLKIYNVERFEGGEYGLTFLFYLKEDIYRYGKGDKIIEAFLNCRKSDSTPLIPQKILDLNYNFTFDIEDNSNNPMRGTEENPLTYKCKLTLCDFVEPEPNPMKCMKPGCSYKNYFGICRNHEDELTDKQLELVEKRRREHYEQVQLFKEDINKIQGSYDFIGESQIQNDEEDDDNESVMVICHP